MSPRRLDWATRAKRTRRRFTLYARVLVELDNARRKGATVEWTWRTPEEQIRDLVRDGGRAVRSFNRKPLSEVPPADIERLERVVARLSDSDDWTQRFRN